MEEQLNKDVHPQGEEELKQDVEAQEPVIDEGLDTEIVADSDEDNEEDNSGDKLYTQKQLERKIEKRVSREKRSRARLEQEIENQKRELEEIKKRMFGNQPQHSSYQPEPEAQDEDWSHLSPQEYARRVIDQERKERERLAQQEQRAKTQQEYYNQLMSNGRKKYEDFEETVNDAEYTPAMVEAASLHDNAEDVLYYYARNWEKTHELAKKSPMEQAREINRVAVRLAAKQVNGRISKAPEPTNAPKGDTRAMGNHFLDALKNPNLSLKELAKLREGK